MRKVIAQTAGVVIEPTRDRK